MKYDKIYQKLKKQYSDEEIVGGMLIPADLEEKEVSYLSSEMREIRFQRLSEMTTEDRVLADIMRLRFDIEDHLRKDVFLFEKTFGKYLDEYIRILNKSKYQIAEDLAIHYTKLSRIINDREEPNIELTYRLDKHSGNLIKAVLWWKLIMKKQEFILSKDEETRQKEEAKVKNYLIAS